MQTPDSSLQSATNTSAKQSQTMGPYIRHFH